MHQLNLLPPDRLLNVEHTEESGKACLYLVSPGVWHCMWGKAAAPARAKLPMLALRQLHALTAMLSFAQVFEYLQMDLKKWMDKGGKGPGFPLPLGTIKVRSSSLSGASYPVHTAGMPWPRQVGACAACACLLAAMLLMPIKGPAFQPHAHILKPAASTAETGRPPERARACPALRT